ncbi:MAG: 4Fe-4S cluster-binding domain-containing protein [Methanomassiliicoccaceae archaeon]|nr:4Fe-4S cluster-binding domain-containing protein [Methanomassiliicoccaceae archaeon]
MIRKMKCGSVFRGDLAEGCEHCMNGSKMVLFLTGVCATGCFYCPVSDEKRGKNVTYANEQRVHGNEEIIAEAESMDATGTGITGGDPLLDVNRTADTVRMLKDRFGKEHHIHLYTSTIDPDKTAVLEAAGLDEIRFHPSVSLWENIGTTGLGKIVSSSKMDIGIEVPAIPGLMPQLEKLISDVSSLGADFININELEFSESNWSMMDSNQYGLKDDLSSAVLGSEDVAKRLVKKFSNVNIHFCSSSFKDSVQLRKRLIRTAERIAREYDVVTKDGTIIKGVIYADDLDRVSVLLRNDYGVPDELMSMNTVKKRIETAPWIVEELANGLPFKCYIIEEYPTADRLEVERMPL